MSAQRCSATLIAKSFDAQNWTRSKPIKSRTTFPAGWASPRAKGKQTLVVLGRMFEDVLAFNTILGEPKGRSQVFSQISDGSRELAASQAGRGDGFKQ